MRSFLRHQIFWRNSTLLLLSIQLCGCGVIEQESQAQGWEQCRTAAQNLLKKHKKKEALHMANEAVSSAQTFGDSDFRYGIALCVLGDVLAANEKDNEAKAAYKKSIKVLNRAEKIAAAKVEQDNKVDWQKKKLSAEELEQRAKNNVQLRLLWEDIANSFEHLGDVYAGQSKPSEAAKSYEKAAEKFEMVINTDLKYSKTPELIVQQQFIRCLLDLAQSASANGDIALADSSFKKAIAQATSSSVNESDRIAIRDDYLKYLQKAGRNSEAASLVADVLYNQLTADGTLALFEGDFTAAEISYRKALEEAAKSVYSEQRILKALFNLITVFVRAGKNDEVYKCLGLSDEYVTKHPTASRKDFDQIQEVLANFYLAAQVPYLARRALLLQMDYKLRKYGPYSKEVCTVWAMLGQVEIIDREHPNTVEANKCANRALSILRDHSLDRSYYDAINKVAQLMMGLNRYEEARELDQKLIDLKITRLDPGDPWLVSLKVNLVVLEQRFHHRDKATLLIREVLKDVSIATPDQQVGSFPYVVLLLAVCVHEKWWDIAEEVAQSGQTILRTSLSNTFPSPTAEESWHRDMAVLQKALNKKFS